MTTVEDAPTAQPVTGVERHPDERRRRRRRLIWPAGGVALLAVGAGAWLWATDPSTEEAPAATGPVATAVVERGTISASRSWDGTLDHGAPFTIHSNAQGTITRIVEQGRAVERGNELHRIDERPVILLYGVVPMYRDLRPGASGVDVQQLETNLAELGYSGFPADDSFTELTSDAVRAWQAAIGAEQTGTVARGDVVFVPEARRVDALRVDVGALVAPGRAILDLTGTAEVVSVEVDVDDRDLVGVGTEVTVVLPSGEELAGTVSSSTPAQVAAEMQGGGNGDDQREAEAVAAVQIALAADVANGLVGSPVEVIITTDERADVLVVPVNALLALSEGGYGLEVVSDDGTTEIVPVDTGLFGGGKVQVEGDGIAEGTVVGVAGR
jgi:peptidoglycan hydrolase-like protein with peptidoglycan-binding domain